MSEPTVAELARDSERVTSMTTAARPEWADHRRMSSNYLDVVRLVLATLVIVGHSFDLVTGEMHSDPVGGFTHGRTSFASLAVDGFFSISGFLISASFLRSKGWRDYLGRRVRRIYPGFAVANLAAPIAVALLGLAAAGGVSAAWELIRYLGRTLLLEEYSPPSPFPGNVNPLFNGSLWTIRYEFLCYLLCGAILSIREGRRLAFALGLVAVATLVHTGALAPLAASQDAGIVGRVVSWLVGVVPSALDERWLRFMLNFGAGMALYLNRARVPRHGAAAVAAVVLSFVVAQWAPDALGYVTPVTLTYVLFWMAFAAPTAAVHFTRRFGDYSYGVYLYAYPVQQTVISTLGQRATPGLVLVLSLPLTFVLAAMSWWLVERHFLPSRASRPQRQAAPA